MKTFFYNLYKSWYVITEDVICELLDYLKPSLDAFKSMSQYNGDNGWFAFVLLFFVGLLYDIYVYVALKLGFSLDLRNPNHLGFRFWFGYAIPTGITLILSAYSFWLLCVMDFNSLNYIIIVTFPCATVCMLAYLNFNHFYLKVPLGRQFCVFQAFGIVLSDMIAGVLAFEGWPFSIMLMILVNMAVTLIAYKMTQNKVYVSIKHLNRYFLNKTNQMLVFFKWDLKFLNTYANVEKNYAYAMYSVLLSSKSFLWTAGMFFGPQKQFDNVDFGYLSLLALGLVWFVTSIRLLYCGAVCVRANKQQLTYPWEVSISYFLSPAPTILTILYASITYFKICGYRKFLRMLRSNCASSKSASHIGNISRWFLDKNIYVTRKAANDSLVIRLANRFLKTQIRRYVGLYALVNALIRPCVLFGKSWVTYQSYFANLQSLLDLSSNVISSSSTWNQAFRKAHQFVSVLAPFVAVSGLAGYPVVVEGMMRHEACEQVSAGDMLQELNVSHPNAEAKPHIDEACKNLKLAKVFRKDSSARTQYTSEAGMCTLNAFSAYGLTLKDLDTDAAGLRALVTTGVYRVIEKQNPSNS